MHRRKQSWRARPLRRLLGSLLSLSTVVTGLAVLGPVDVANADPGHPGVPHEPVELFHEGFQNIPGDAENGFVMLDEYERADGGSYTADPGWISLSACNGIVLTPATTATPGCAFLGELQGLASDLGDFNGLGETNGVLSAYTAGDPGGGIQVATDEPLSIGTVENRFLTFSVNIAAVNCNSGRPALSFFLIDDADVAHPVNDTPINPCPGANSGTGQFYSDGSILFSGDTVGIRMFNGQGSGNGNDFAIDDIRLFDATPQLDKEFAPGPFAPGKDVELTFTVTNTTDLAEKAGWSFTDHLPAGMIVANDVVETDCAAATVAAVPGTTAIVVTDGTIAADDVSCSITVLVTSGVAGTGTNGPGNIADLVGLLPPGDSSVTFEDLPAVTPPLPTCTEDDVRATQRWWRFGNGVGIDFGTSGATAVPFAGSGVASEGSTVVTDTEGNLQFWSNGQAIFNRDDDVMPNGGGLSGNPSATQTVASFPAIDQPGIYFVVTTTGTAGDPAAGRLAYSVVDMSLDGGRGDVVAGQKDLPLGAPGTASEALTAIPNADGTGFWVLTFTQGSPDFLAHPFGSAGPAGPPVVSQMDSPHLPFYGSINVSADLTQLVSLASANNGATDVRLVDFDAATGAATERIAWSLPVGAGTGATGYTADFSPSGDYVYATKIFSGGRLYRYDIVNNTTPFDLESNVEALGSIGTNGGQVRRAPDGRMYVAASGEDTISVVSSPDAADPGFLPGGLPLPEGTASTFGLPQTATGCPQPLPPTIDVDLCADTGLDYYRFDFSAPVDGEGAGGPGSWARYADVAEIEGVPVDMVATVISGGLSTPAGRPNGFGADGGNAAWNLASAGSEVIEYSFFVAGTDVPIAVNAAFVASDMDTGETASVALSSIASYSLAIGTAVTVTEVDGNAVFAGNGDWSGDPESAFQLVLEGVESLQVEWSGFQNSGFFFNGNGNLSFPPQCWDADKTVLSEHPAAPGARLDYQVVVSNSGEVPLTDLTMVDDLGGVLASASWAGNASATSGSVAFDPVAETLTWTGDLPVEGTATITYSVVIDPEAEVGDELVNRISGPTSCPGPACTTTTEVVPPVPLFFDCSALATFDTGNEGWRVATTTEGFIIILPPAPIDWVPDEGNPDGAIVSDDLDGGWTEVWTPELAANGIATDYSGAVGDSLQFDYRNDTGIDYDVYVAIKGANGDRIFYVFRPQVIDSTEWTTVIVPMVASEWHTGFNEESGPVGPAPTETELVEILADVDHFAFSVEGQSGVDRTLFDNFGVTCPEPGLSIEKIADHDDADGDGELSVDEVITYEFLVANTGNVLVTDIVVSDELPGLSEVDCPSTQLAPATDPMVCQATYVVTQADIDAGGVTNIAVVSGSGPGDEPLEEPSNEIVVDGPEHDPGLSLLKTAEPLDRDGDGLLDAGETIMYRFSVTNTGNVTMTGVGIDDPMDGLSEIDCPTDVLAPGESVVCTASYVVSEEDAEEGLVVNTATAHGVGPAGDAVVLSDTSTARTEVDGSTLPATGTLPRTGSDARALVAVALTLLLFGLHLLRQGWRAGHPGRVPLVDGDSGRPARRRSRPPRSAVWSSPPTAMAMWRTDPRLRGRPPRA